MDERGELDPVAVTGVRYLRRIFPLLKRLSTSGCERDLAGNRRLLFSQYAGLVLVSLFNPTLQSLQGLSDVSRLKKVQKLLGAPHTSVGSLSESVRVFEPALLEKIFLELLESLPVQANRTAYGSIPEDLVRRLTAVDGTALRVLPQLIAAAGDSQGKWRMHLQFEVWRGVPEQAVLTRDEVGGDADERSVLSANLRSGRVYIDDRGYERYSLCEDVVRAGSDYVTRVQRRPMAQIEPRELTPSAVAAGVLSDELVKAGQSRTDVGRVTHQMRRIVIAGGVPQGRPRTDRSHSKEIVLLTSLVDVPAEIIAAIYRLRWVIELFFRFFKHVLGCKHLLSTKPEGIAIQVYCALIAALLMTIAAGGPVGRRGFTLICLYLQGWADEDELIDGLKRIAAKKSKG